MSTIAEERESLRINGLGSRGRDPAPIRLEVAAHLAKVPIDRARRLAKAGKIAGAVPFGRSGGYPDFLCTSDALRTAAGMRK